MLGHGNRPGGKSVDQVVTSTSGIERRGFLSPVRHAGRMPWRMDLGQGGAKALPWSVRPVPQRMSNSHGPPDGGARENLIVVQDPMRTLSSDVASRSAAASWAWPGSPARAWRLWRRQPRSAPTWAVRPAWPTAAASSHPTRRDIAILRFLAAAELIETDLWQQYAELAQGNPRYGEALESIDDDLPVYAVDVTEDELSHAEFINAYLHSIGAEPVNLDRFRVIASPPVTGLRADRQAHQPHRPHGQHQLLQALPEHHATRTSAPPSTRSPPSMTSPRSRPPTASATRRWPASSAWRRSTSPGSSRAAPASTTSSSPTSPAARCCASSARSTPPRPSTTRSSAIR